MNDANPDKLLTTREAAKLLSFSEQTLGHWRMSGKGPRYISFNSKAVRYRRSDLQAWLDSMVQDPAEAAS